MIPPRIKALEEGIELTEKGGVVSQFGPTGPGEVLTIDPNYFFLEKLHMLQVILQHLMKPKWSQILSLKES